MPQYEWFLCKSPDLHNPFANNGALTQIAPLWRAQNRQFQLVRNRAGQASFQLRLNDELIPEIFDNLDVNDVRGTVRHAIRIVRNGVTLFTGPIWGIQTDLEAGTAQFNCVGWFETLVKRLLWTTLDFANQGNGTPADTIAFAAINFVNQQDSGLAPDMTWVPPGTVIAPGDPTHPHPLLVRPGTSTGDFTQYPRNRYYLWGQTGLWALLQELSDIEAGYDIVLDPDTREVNLFTWDQYANRTDIKLGYNWGPRNLKDVQWTEDASQMVNLMGVVSLGAPVYVNDPTSMDQYDLYAEYNTLSSANQTILQPYGVAELVIRSRPLVTYTVTPQVDMQTKGPVLFDDFQVGDMVYFSARKESLLIDHQAIRVFGATIQLDENDNEQITALQTTPTTGG